MVRKSKFVDVVLSSYLTPFETDDDRPSRRKTKVGFARYSDGCTNGIGKDGGHAERGYGFNKERRHVLQAKVRGSHGRNCETEIETGKEDKRETCEKKDCRHSEGIAFGYNTEV